MKIISLWQPWASLWASGHKRIETRGWPMYGPFPRTLAVHASKRFGPDQRRVCWSKPFSSALAAIGYGSADDLPLGCVVGVVTVVRFVRYVGGDEPTGPERQFGDHSVGRYGWVTDGNRLLAEPVPLVGRQGLWDWTPPGELVFAEGGQLTPPAEPAAGPAQLDLFGGPITGEVWR